MNVGVLVLGWTMVLFVVSYRMLGAPLESQGKYSELLGNLILLALFTVIITAFTG